MDKARQFLESDEVSYALNNDILNTTAGGKNTPLPSNYLGCGIEMPLGDSFSIGSHYAELTNETYVFVANTNNAHFIYRNNADGSCQIVNDSDCLQSVFGTNPDVFNPKHSFEEWRIMLRVEKTCKNRHGKTLIFTNGLGNIGSIDVDASIATNSFSTPFFDRLRVDCETVELCVPQPCDCPTATFSPLSTQARGLSNKILDIGFKFMYRFVYYDLRASEWSDYSSLYYQDSKSCSTSSNGLPRCMRLNIPLGNPLVDKIEIAVSQDNGFSWSLYDTVEKYSSYTSSTQYWYERSLNPDLSLINNGTAFQYIFCNDKQCTPIDPKETSRVFNPAPRHPQGFIQVKDLLGWYNFEAGNCPLDKVQADKFEINLDCTSNASCTPEYVTVKVRAIVHSFYYGGKNTPIVRKEGAVGGEDDPSDPAVFHVAMDLQNSVIEPAYRGQFASKKRNFTAFIEGTDQFVEMKQWKADNGFVNKSLVGVVSGVGNGRFIPPQVYYQEATFKVRKGTKGFIRLMSHESETNTPHTSTYIKGTLNNIATYTYFGVVEDQPSFNAHKNEIFFDTTGGSVDLTETFIIENPAKVSGLTSHSAAFFFGYLRLEDNTPIEFAEFWRASTRWMVTDHNGFFFRGFDNIPENPEFSVLVETACNAPFSSIKTATLAGGYQRATQTNVTLLDSETTGYKNKFKLNLNVRVVDCLGQPVSGLTVAVSNSKAETTQPNGIATFELRNKSTRDRIATAVVMSSKDCFVVNCNGDCNAPLPHISQGTPACYDTALTPTLQMSNLVVNTDTSDIQVRGLKKGGRYGWGIVAKGACGRISAVYPIKKGHIDIPKLQEAVNPNFCSFNYNANGIALPDWVTCLSVVRTQNLAPFELQWVVDKIERTPDGKIKLTIQSLNDYNASYLFKTNTVYKYLAGDRIEFIRNGNGLLIDFATNGILNYAALSPFNTNKDEAADSFNQLLIEDDNKLDFITKGAVIEIQRAKNCETELEYHSVCATINVENGQVVNQTGSFNTFDTYYVRRTIGEFGQMIFEHHSPSDFWGEKLSDTGKVYFENKYENERRYGRSIILSYADEFNRFDSTLIKTFDAPEQGDITAMSIVDGKVIMAIAEHDTLVAQVSDTLVRMGNDGLVRAAQPDQIISDHEPKLSGVFGCKYNSIGSVLFGDGYTLFTDTAKAAEVQHNYSIAEDVSEGKIKSYMKRICTQMQKDNQVAGNNFINHYRFVTGINKHDNRVYRTFKKLTDASINNERQAYTAKNATQMYFPPSKDWLGFAAFTPEFYSTINLMDDNGASFISYYRGEPYIHPIIPIHYMEFYGLSTDWILTFSVNKPANKIKRGLAMEIQDADMLWYAHKVETDEDGWVSEIPPIRASRQEDNVYLAFLANINSRGGLYGDDNSRGVFISVTIIRDNSLNLVYNSVNPAKRKLFSSLGLITTKFMYSEMSGYTHVNT